MEASDIITVDEVAKLLHVSTNRVYKMTSRKGIPFMKVTGKLLFNRKSVLAWMAKQETKGAVLYAK